MKFSTEMKKEMGILCLVTGLLMLIPLFNVVGPESGPFSVSAFQVSLWGKYLTYAVLAMSLNLLWGYTGLLCLCQSLFFALGGYAMGMYLMLMTMLHAKMSLSKVSQKSSIYANLSKKVNWF